MCSVGGGHHLNALYLLSSKLKILSTSDGRGYISLFFIYTYTHNDMPDIHTHPRTHTHVPPHGAGRGSINVGWAEGSYHWGCWGWMICSEILETLLCGYTTATALPSWRVRAPGTKGTLPSNVTNMMWHVSACSGTSFPFTHTAALYPPPPRLFLWHTNTHTARKRHFYTK